MGIRLICVNDLSQHSSMKMALVVTRQQMQQHVSTCEHQMVGAIRYLLKDNMERVHF